MKGALFVVDSFEDVIDVIVHDSYSVYLLFCGGGGEFVVVVKVYGSWIKAIMTAIGGDFLGSGGCGIVGKFCER